MTCRAFLALRVIQRQGKSSFNMLVKNWCEWFTKMKIAQNLWVRLTSKQFSPLRLVKTYPGMHSVCQLHSLREIPTGGCIFASPRIFRKSERSCNISENFRPCRGLSTWKGASPLPNVISRKHMTRRAFLALRVIQRQGESSFNMLVKK